MAEPGAPRPLRGTWPAALLTALAPVLALLEDDRITEIEANGFNDVWARVSGWRGHQRMEGVEWRDREDFRIACIRISDVIGRRVSEDRPILNARLPGGERVNIAIPPACDRIALTIRKFPAEAMSFDLLERLGSVNGALRSLCRALVLARKSILVAGGTGSGKTSLVNALSREIPRHERIVTIEDARELQIQQPNWVAMESVEPYADDAVPVTIGELLRNSLRQCPDRIIVGEVRGEEAFHLLRAFSTGHAGGFGTIHANDGEDALHQLQLLAQMSPFPGLTTSMVASMVSRTVDVVIYQKLDEDQNVRRVTEVLEVDRPGVTFGQGGAIFYRVRRLVAWESARRMWLTPEAPSPRLRRALGQVGLEWPGNGS
jgi:pilus assembly protein CpaF